VVAEHAVFLVVRGDRGHAGCGGGGLAGGVDVQRVVFGGATLLGNDQLRSVLVGVAAAHGREALVLEHAGYAGALGALGIAALGAAPA